MRSVSASCWLSGKQTPSSALCAQSKRLQTPFGITGEWLFPHSCGCPERFGGPGVLAPARGDPSSACRSNLRVSGGVVACPCGLYLSSHVSVPRTHPVTPFPRVSARWRPLRWSQSRWCAFAPAAQPAPPVSGERPRCPGGRPRDGRALRLPPFAPRHGAHACARPDRGELAALVSGLPFTAATWEDATVFRGPKIRKAPPYLARWGLKVCHLTLCFTRTL